MLHFLKVAVIGAGAAGLSAGRQLISKNFNFTIFEGTSQVGGTWFYTDKIGNDQFGNPLHTSMYENLRTNLPKQAMAFPDFPFNSSLPSFLKHSDVYDYLVDFCDEYKLKDHIKFNNYVRDIKLFKKDDKDQWEINAYDYNLNKTHSEVFDAVVVCNGHYFYPNKPHISGIDKFQGAVMHSHDYRKPNDYKDQNVVLLGARSSAIDISVDLHKTAKNVYLSNRGKKLDSRLPANVFEKPMISHFTENEVVFNDGSVVTCNTFMYCTGYLFKFPFLDSTNLIKSETALTPLYKHLVHIEHPTLSFIGLPSIICPFPLFHYQSVFVTGVIDGSIILPSKKEMYEDETKEQEERLLDGLRVDQSHFMGSRQWKYNKDLAEACGIDKPSDLIENAYTLATERKRIDVLNYKNDIFCLAKNGLEYEVRQESTG